MMTRNRKRRNAGKDESCPQISNHKNSLSPGNHAMEVCSDTVMMVHGGISGGLHNHGQRTKYLQVAWLLREKLNDLLDGDKGQFPELELQSLLNMAASRNIVAVDPKMLNPVLWRALPKELLQLIFARLPVPDIPRLRSVSREWRRDLATMNSDINQACDEASPSMVALLSNSPTTDAFLVSIYDIAKRRWQCSYRIKLQRLRSPVNDGSTRTWTTVEASDGGLVCFISLWKPTKLYRLWIVVVNLLTRVQHELPSLHYQHSALPAMVQIEVDAHTKCYQVVVTGYRRGGPAIEIYNSVSRQWKRAAPPTGPIFGTVHEWTSISGWCHKFSTTPGIYHFSEGKLEDYGESNPSTAESVIDWVLHKDRMSVLQEQPQLGAAHRGLVHRILCVTDYHFEKEAKGWVEGKSWDCPSFEELTVDDLNVTSLYACDGFLMLIVYHGGRSDPYFWLLDLSTGEWSNLPENPNSKGMPTNEIMLCRAVWNAIP